MARHWAGLPIITAGTASRVSIHRSNDEPVQVRAGGRGRASNLRRRGLVGDAERPHGNGRGRIGSHVARCRERGRERRRVVRQLVSQQRGRHAVRLPMRHLSDHRNSWRHHKRRLDGATHRGITGQPARSLRSERDRPGASPSSGTGASRGSAPNSFTDPNWWTTAGTCPPKNAWYSSSAPMPYTNSASNPWRCVLNDGGSSVGQAGDWMAVATDNCTQINGGGTQCQNFKSATDLDVRCGNYDGKPAQGSRPADPNGWVQLGGDSEDPRRGRASSSFPTRLSRTSGARAIPTTPSSPCFASRPSTS